MSTGSWERRAEVEDARCLLIAACPSWRDLCDELRACAGDGSRVPTKHADAGAPVDPAVAMVPPTVKFACAVAGKLGQPFRDWRVTIRENFASLVAHGHVPAPAGASAAAGFLKLSAPEAGAL